MNLQNPQLSNVLETDSYKLSHWVQYPPKTTEMYSYFESRGGKYNYTLFFGLQYYLKRFISQRITLADVEEAKDFAKLHREPFNYEGWKYIAEKLGGKLPVRIKAVPEGSLIPKKNILMSIESTDPKVFWVVNWIETNLVRLWYPITVATESYEIKKVIRRALDKSSDDTLAELLFKLHDFGSRGSTSQESAMIGGASHLVNFMGSDTIAGIWMANQYYDIDMAGFSIPASEHSTMTMWGREGEEKAFANMIKQYGKTPIFACVSDSYDIYNASQNLWGDKLKKKVEEMNAMLVVRPDSGDPFEVVMKLLNILGKKFGTTKNTKGYKVLNNVRIIQGDGINKDDIKKILKGCLDKGFSASNLAFGMGAGLLQKDMNRDTHEFAFKCCYAKVDGKDVKVYKKPVDQPMKKSKAGKLDLVLRDGRVKTTPDFGSDESMLEVVFENGELKKNITMEEVRKNTEIVYEQGDFWTDKELTEL